MRPLSPAQPPLKVEEGERATESATFRTAVIAVSPQNAPVIFDTANRIRRVEGGRMVTLAGTGGRADDLAAGPARETALPNVTQILFSPSGELHFVAVGRVWRVRGDRLEAVAGTGRAGFNGESGMAVEVNLGGIVQAAFDATGRLLILDGHARLRRLESDGTLHTIAGSPRPAATAGFTGDNGPATQAALSSPRQVVPFADGSLWIKDFSGRHIRILTPDGIIRTVNSNFEPTINILPLADGTPGAATANRMYPLRANGGIETGSAPYRGFTGTPRAVAPDGALLFEGSARPDMNTPLVRLTPGPTGVQNVLGGAPPARIVDGQAAPFGAIRNGSLLYSSTLDGKSGVLEARPGQTPRFVAGGGNDTGEPEGKNATDLAIYGIVAFTVDNDGRIIIADVWRRRILVVGADNKVTVLKAGGEPVVYAPLGTFSTLQRLTADRAGNIYWFQQGATPTGSVFTAEINVWSRSASTIARFNVPGLAALARLDDGNPLALAGNSATFRTAYALDAAAGQGAALGGLQMLPFTSLTRLNGRPYFVAASRLFRGEPGSLEYFDLPLLPSGAAFTPDFAVAGAGQLLVHLTDGGFYRVENPDTCPWQPQPLITADGVVNAASYGHPNAMSVRQLLTVFGRGLGPAEGFAGVVDGILRASAQPAPYPSLQLGNFSGAIPNATLTGTVLPVVYSNARQVTVQAVPAVPASGTYLLYYGWQGLTLIYPKPIAVRAAAPGLFPLPLEPVQAGGTVNLYATGLGAIATSLGIGEFFPATPVAVTATPLTLWIGGVEAEIRSAAGLPGSLGVVQIEAVVPATLGPGEHLVEISSAGQTNAGQTVLLRVAWN